MYASRSQTPTAWAERKCRPYAGVVVSLIAGHSRHTYPSPAGNWISTVPAPLDWGAPGQAASVASEIAAALVDSQFTVRIVRRLQVACLVQRRGLLSTEVQ